MAESADDGGNGHAVQAAMKAVRGRPLGRLEEAGLQVVSGAMPPQAFATVAALMDRLYRADAEMAEAAGEQPRDDGRDASETG